MTYFGHYLQLYMCVKEFVVLTYSGALTKGDRRAATGAEFSEFNFDTQYGRSALRQMYNSLRTVSCFLHCLVTFVGCVTHIQIQMVGGVDLQKVCSLSGSDPSITPEQFLITLQVHI